MISVRANLIANFLGRGWGAFLGILFIPIYVKFVGIEAYGLIAFNATLFAIFSLLDIGISSTLNREMARLSGMAGQAQKARDLLKTFQSIYLSVAILIGVIVALSAPLIARHWLNVSALVPEVVERVIMLMGLVISAQMLFGFYSAGLLGLQHQVTSNVMTAAIGTVRTVGAVVVLASISPTVTAFFVWQAVSGVVATIVAAVTLWRKLGRGEEHSRFRFDLVLSSGRFAAGMGTTSVISLLLNQTDKLVLSKLLSLEFFGYYALAGAVASALHYIGSPIFTAYFPVLTQRHASSDAEGLYDQYHNATQVLAVALFPLASVLVGFPKEILAAWTNNPDTVRESYQLLRLLSLATAFNVLASIPYCLQLAHGWTRLGMLVNATAVLIVVPSLMFAVSYWGALGAASALVVINAGYLFIFVHLMHRKIMPRMEWRWYSQDIIPPMASVLAVSVAARLLVNAPESRSLIFFQLVAIYLAMVICAAWSAPRVRAALIHAMHAKAFFGKRDK